jgi:hypothetical protein
VQKPTPVEGLVIRYDFLWQNEYQRGHMEGQKDRPCAIVIAVPEQNGAVERIIVAPITHAKPLEGVQAIEIPQKVKRHLGLDEERSWIIIDDLNRVRWDDPGIVPVSRSKWEYGALPQALLIQVQDQVRTQAKARKASLLDREKIEKRRTRDDGRGR